MKTQYRSGRGSIPLAVLLLLALETGCGTLKSQSATEQLLMSDAVDRAVAQVDFGVLYGEKVYLDTQYIKSAKATGFVNADYITSSLRNKLVASSCLLQEKPEQADYIVEVRVGALGTDSHEVTYGIPASSGLDSAASLVPNAPRLPTIPEIALAKRSDQQGAAKIALFAYHRKTNQGVWQSGISLARSNASGIWVAGAGPFQRGTIFTKPQFAGAELSLPLISTPREEEFEEQMLSYEHEREFDAPPPAPLESAVETATFQQEEAGARKAKGESRSAEPTPARSTKEPPKTLDGEALKESRSVPPPDSADN